MFNIVLPKRCQRVGHNTVWRAGRITTRVLGRKGGWPPAGTSAPPLGSGEYYLASDDRPGVVYRYLPDKGVRTIYYDHRGQTDFAASARAGTLDRLERELLADPLRQHMVMTLITLDSFGACDPPPRGQP